MRVLQPVGLDFAGDNAPIFASGLANLVEI